MIDERDITNVLLQPENFVGSSAFLVTKTQERNDTRKPCIQEATAATSCCSMQADPYIKRTPVNHMIAACAPKWLRRIAAVFNVSAAMTSHGVGGKHLPMKIFYV